MEYFCVMWRHSIQKFIMIVSFVPVNETVTDFCCVLNFVDIKGSCTVFWYIV